VKEHSLERLSAYLDGDLRRDERTAVEAHLAECAECSRRLEEYARLDVLARKLPVEPPEDYFESFSGRVRARLENPEQARRPWKLPVWSWAAAAALVVAVVAPLTLREPLGSRRAAPAAAPRQDVPKAPPAAAPAPSRDGSRALEILATRDLAPPPAATPASPARSGEAVRQEASRGRDQASLRVMEPEPSLAGAPAAAGARVSAPDREDAHPAAEAQPAADADAFAERQKTGPFATEEWRSGARERPAALEASAAQGPGGSRAQPQAGQRALLAGADAQQPWAPVLESLLLHKEPRTASEYHALRRSWLAFARQYPESRWADEARVRALEALLAAYRSGGDRNDLQLLGEEARGYLASPDARQKPRVRALLEGAEK